MTGQIIVGYLYGAGTYCPDCVRELFLPFDLIEDDQRTTEQILDMVAQQRGIDRQATDSFSSYRFPVPLIRPHASIDDRCGLCDRHLIEPV